MSVLSQEYYERSKKVTPGGVHSPVRAFKNVDTYPRFIVNGHKSQIKDIDGQTYVDYCLSWGPLVLGHADPDVTEAVNSAVSNGWTYGAADVFSLELAELITSQIPWVEQVRFVNSGTEAVMSALRLARAATGKNKVLKFDGCYHGHVDSMLVAAGSGLAEMATPDSAGISDEVASQTIVAPLDDLKAVEEILSVHADDIAAVIIEPVPANNGLLIQKEGYLQDLVTLVRRYGVLVIFDEVITGFRLAFGGVAEMTGIKPDLVTYGKVIGGGFPVGAFGGRKDLMSLVAPEGPVYQAGTLSANPVAMSAGLATLKKLLRLDPYKQLSQMTERMGQRLNDLSSQVPVDLTVQNIGSIFWVGFGAVESEDGRIRTPEQIPKQQKAIYSSLYPKILSQGYYLAPSGYEVGFVSTQHTDEQNDALVDALVDALISALKKNEEK